MHKKRLSRKLQNELSIIRRTIQLNSRPYVGDSMIISGSVVNGLANKYPEAYKIYLEREREQLNKQLASRMTSRGFTLEDSLQAYLDEFKDGLNDRRTGRIDK